MKFTSNRTNERYAWLDECKGIGIILVVLGHALVSSIRGENQCVQFVHKMIYYFHMPFMMVLSGLAYQLFSQRTKVKGLIQKKIKRLLIPYVSYAVAVQILILICIKLPGIRTFFYNNGYGPEKIKDFVIGLLIGNNKYAIHLWYIYTLFCFYAFVISTRKIIGNKSYVGIGILLFTIKCIVNTDNMYIINDICTLFIWFAIGMNTKLDNDINKFYEKKKLRRLAWIAGIVYFVCDIIFIPTPRNPVLYTVHTVVKFSFIYNVILCIIFECRYTEKTNRKLRFLGEKSFSIYLFHQPFFCMGVTTLCAGRVPDIVAIGMGVISSFVFTIFIDHVLDFKYMKFAKKIFKGG